MVVLWLNNCNIEVVVAEQRLDRLKLALKKCRFVEPLAEVDANSLCEPFVPNNTRKQTDWVLSHGVVLEMMRSDWRIC